MWIIVPKNLEDYNFPEKFALGNTTSSMGVQYATDDCSFIAIYRTREEAREALRDSGFAKTHMVRAVDIEVF